MAYPGYGGYGGSMPGAPPQVMPMGGAPMPMGGASMPMGGAPMPMGGAPMRGPPVAGYGGYSAAFNTPPAHDQMWDYFIAIAGQDGEVDADELQTCLTQTGICGTYMPFSLDTCRIMIAMLDRDYSGKMGFTEFKELFAALIGWKQNFMMVDKDNSGTIEPLEMNQSITTLGYRLSPQVLNSIIKRYSRGGRIYFDDYVACCVKLRAMTDYFRRRDTMQQGAASFQYDDFIHCTMSI